MASSVSSPVPLLLFLSFFAACPVLLCNARLNFASGAHNYSDALFKSLLFFEGQRSGNIPRDQRLTWRRTSGLTDGHLSNVDLVGGYYDAGDNVKFGFPMAFTTTMLSWSVVEFGGKMSSQVVQALEAIRWATDYLLKATAYPDTIYVQVGDANRDHACWERPEEMDTPRTVLKVDPTSPGSDVAAETAAALAAASVVFRRSDPRYAQVLRSRAIEVFQFADKYRGSYSDNLHPMVCPFYCSYSGYQDELLWAAAWLFKSTGSLDYLNYIHENEESLGAGEGDSNFGWDNKHVGARILLSKAFLVQGVQSLNNYKGRSDNFICSLFPGGSSFAQFTPGGLLHTMSDNNLQYVTSTSFLLVTYAKYLASSHRVVQCGGNLVVTPTHLRALAKKQVDYILGDNPLKMSYMVGYGPVYPQRIHHRGSSLPSMAAHPDKIDCSAGFGFYESSGPNPNILAGAVVGGPDQNDGFKDDRADYQQSEPTTYTNAPLVGALTYLAHSFRQL